jgi:predicted N-acetyltransferase YhbS
LNVFLYRNALARHLVPVIILTRLAVDTKQQGRGLGQALLKDALLRTVQAADIVGIRALFLLLTDLKVKVSG